MFTQRIGLYGRRPLANWQLADDRRPQRQSTIMIDFVPTALKLSATYAPTTNGRSWMNSEQIWAAGGSFAVPGVRLIHAIIPCSRADTANCLKFVFKSASTITEYRISGFSISSHFYRAHLEKRVWLPMVSYVRVFWRMRSTTGVVDAYSSQFLCTVTNVCEKFEPEAVQKSANSIPPADNILT